MTLFITRQVHFDFFYENSLQSLGKLNQMILRTNGMFYNIMLSGADLGQYSRQPTGISDSYSLIHRDVPVQRSDVGRAILQGTAQEALTLIRSEKYFPFLECGSSNLILAIKNRPDPELYNHRR